jgi:HEAT repeat protein
MTVTTKEAPVERAAPVSEAGDRSDWKVVLQFFIVPLALVAVLVTVFFGLQILRSRHPDPRTALHDLQSTGGFLLPWVGDPKRWQSGYDLSLLLRSGEKASAPPVVQDIAGAFREARLSGDLKLRRYLALALGRSGDPRAGAALGEGLTDPDGETRLYSAWGLMRVGDASALPILRQAAASDADAGVRNMAVFSLGQLGDRDGAPVLRKALEDPDADVRCNAAIALARVGDASGAAALIEVLERVTPGEAAPETNERTADGSPALNAIRALALLHDARARAALERAARSGGSEEIRRTARLAIEPADPAARGTAP